MLDFGDVLINNVPKETTEFLKGYFTESNSGKKTYDGIFNDKNSSPNPQDYLHLFLNKSEYLVEFLEHLIEVRSGWNKQIYNALVEHLLVSLYKENGSCISMIRSVGFHVLIIILIQVVWSRAEGNDKTMAEQRLMKLLQNPDALYDKDQTFILCRMYNFSPGIILLYEENKMYVYYI